MYLITTNATTNAIMSANNSTPTLDEIFASVQSTLAQFSEKLKTADDNAAYYADAYLKLEKELAAKKEEYQAALRIRDDCNNEKDKALSANQELKIANSKLEMENGYLRNMAKKSGPQKYKYSVRIENPLNAPAVIKRNGIEMTIEKEWGVLKYRNYIFRCSEFLNANDFQYFVNGKEIIGASINSFTRREAINKKALYSMEIIRRSFPGLFRINIKDGGEIITPMTKFAVLSPARYLISLKFKARPGLKNDDIIVSVADIGKEYETLDPENALIGSIVQL